MIRNLALLVLEIGRFLWAACIKTPRAWWRSGTTIASRNAVYVSCHRLRRRFGIDSTRTIIGECTYLAALHALGEDGHSDLFRLAGRMANTDADLGAIVEHLRYQALVWALDNAPQPSGTEAHQCQSETL